MMSHTPSVLILGAGIGGLVTGAYLARQGAAVSVHERAVSVGGSAGRYTRRGRTFPTGATIAFGLESGGALRAILDELDIPMPVRTLAHPMDVVLGDRTVPIFSDIDSCMRALAQAFPERATAVCASWMELCALADSVLAITSARLSLPVTDLRDLQRVFALFRRQPSVLLRAGLHSTATVADFLRNRKLLSYTPFVQFINAQLVDSLQTDCYKAALLPASVALTIYRRGSFAIDGGLARLTQDIADRLCVLGGDIQLANTVAHCTWDKSTHSWQVQTRKGDYTADYLVDATGTSIPGLSQHVRKQPEQLWGALRMDAFYTDPLPSISTFPFAYQIRPSRSHAALFGDPEGAVYITVHPATLAGYPITISVHTPVATWESLSSDDYRVRKQLVQEAFIEECARVLPNAYASLIAQTIGTPRTYLTYIAKAAVGGGAMTVGRTFYHPIGSTTKHPRLFRAG